MSKNWWADKYYARETVDETMNAMIDSNYDGQFCMEQFEGYNELPDLLITGVTKAGEANFGPAFASAHEYNRPLQVYLHRSTRNTTHDHQVDVSIQFGFRVNAVTRWLFGKGPMWHASIDNRLKVFDTTFKVMKSLVISRYPDAVCSMTHSGGSGSPSYKFVVRLTSRLPVRLAA